MTGKRVLVTGHAGYVGCIVVPMLIEAGYDVVGMDINLFAACTFSTPPPPVPALDRDIRDADADDLAGFDAVIHLAGLSNDPLGDLDPDLTGEINRAASIHLAEAVATPSLYFSQHEKLTHSHPDGERHWALFDQRQNSVENITVDRALRALAEMQQKGGGEERATLSDSALETHL